MAVKRTGRRRKGIRWDYIRDGQFTIERVKGRDKRYWKRWLRHTYRTEDLDGRNDQGHEGRDRDTSR